MKTLWLVLTLTTVLGLTLVGFIEFGELCDLEAVTLDGAAVDNWNTRYGLSPNRSLVDQPTDELARDLMKRRGVARVELTYSLPGRLDIQTNRFIAACFAIDRVNGTMRGLTADGRIIELPAQSADWQHPILTGVSLGALHQRCRDLRVLQVIPELISLNETDSISYALLREIDFTSPDYLEATFDDLDAQVRVSHSNLAEEVRRFRSFYLGVHPASDSGKIFDARHGSTVIQYVPTSDSTLDSTQTEVPVSAPVQPALAEVTTKTVLAEPTAMQLANTVTSSATKQTPSATIVGSSSHANTSIQKKSTNAHGSKSAIKKQGTQPKAKKLRPGAAVAKPTKPLNTNSPKNTPISPTLTGDTNGR